MIRIAILNLDTSSLDHVADNLRQSGFAATTAFDSANLSTWLTKNGIDMLILPPQNFLASTSSTSNTKTQADDDRHWRLNLLQLELITPGGISIQLSHNECCILKAAAGANGKLVSRKALIEALGQDFWHYDERRLESLISRLRRKLTSYTPELFRIRGIKGQGYLFKEELRIVEF